MVHPAQQIYTHTSVYFTFLIDLGHPVSNIIQYKYKIEITRYLAYELMYMLSGHL